MQINDAFVELLGYSRSHLLSRPFIDFVHEDDVERTLKELECIGTGTQTVNFENRYVDVNGDTKILSWKSTLDSESNYVFATARDVTAERLAVNKYSQLYNVVTDNIIFVKTDIKGVIIEVNDMFCAISGYSREELIGQTHKIINSGHHDKDFFMSMWKTIRRGKVWTGAITNKRKDGSLYIVESIVAPLVDINGKVEAFIALRQDITERIEYQKSSQKNLDILNETGEIAKVGGWELDVNTNRLFWTDETFKILDVEQKQGSYPVLDEGLQLFTDEHKPLIENAVSQAIELGRPYAMELQAKTPKGDVKWVYTTGKANYKDNKLISLSGTIQDIHEKKIAEIKYQQERQRSIQNAKFAALGELAASVAHEINNPLGIISGYAELIKYHGKVDQNKLDAIMKSCSRISHIVKNLKRFSRSDTAPQKKPVDLAEIIQDAISLTQPRARRHLAQISFFCIAEYIVMGNHIELEQVIINLVNNAIDAVSKKALKTIDISISEESDNYMVLIEDSGGGVEDNLKLRMFEPFVTTKIENKGTGLGLSVVKGILEDHCAQIEVSNTELGAQFRIILKKHKSGVSNG